MDSMRGSANNIVVDLESAKRSLEFSGLGQNELWKKSESEKQHPITWTIYDDGKPVTTIVMTPTEWRRARRKGLMS